ncbi:prolyl oligopeptidase family serine peptidase [Bacillus lacus]|uniref:Prolyl oligopeptidase family serine peptidase n=1 Tax=Metabacillus lacus TaxID=1983721 RepID=A0A7X2J167_9BACI|nr:prolyl oligopeptidase family serine peptidase [Metabacillus lacus]MRX73480.1 prolyl oligopeptidase family serine peptidase [Metabacillus lacus]
MVIIEKLYIEKLPVLHIVKENAQTESVPLVIFIHGFTSAKEMNLQYAYLMAERGLRVVLPDVALHGERSKNIPLRELSLHFWSIVLQTISEIEQIKEHFENKNLLNSVKTGVAGTSLGGITTLGALTQYPWIAAAVSLMGDPAYGKMLERQISGMKQQSNDLPMTEMEIQEQAASLRKYDLSIHTELLKQRPLLFWHGEKDQVVPIQQATLFYEKVKPAYKKHPENIQFITDPHAEHKVSMEGMFAAAEWLAQHLKA